MRQWIHRANQFLSGLAGWLMFAMMMLLIADVIMRTFGKPLLLMAELSVFDLQHVLAPKFGARYVHHHRDWVRAPDVQPEHAQDLDCATSGYVVYYRTVADCGNTPHLAHHFTFLGIFTPRQSHSRAILATTPLNACWKYRA